MKILFLPKYDTLGASSRYRTFQYLPYLEREGISFDVRPLLSNKYLRYKYNTGNINKKLVINSFLNRLKVVLFEAKHYDALVIEKELFPYSPAFLESYLSFIKKPYIVDYDDAIWHNYDLSNNLLIRLFLRNKIKAVMKKAALVIGGSEYITAFAKIIGVKVVKKIPTVIDLKKYHCPEAKSQSEFIVGWIGSPATSKYILEINNTLSKFTRRHKNSIVHLIGFNKTLKHKLSFRYKIIEWSEETEVDELCKIDVGIMPLTDGPFERGKCGFKLIQYMGCKKPVIASAIGENNVIIEDGVNGFLVNNEYEWLEALKKLYYSSNLKMDMGTKGYEKVKNYYSLTKMNKVYINSIKEIFNKNHNVLS